MSEIIVVVVTLGLLSLVAVPVYSGIRRSSLENAAMHSVRLINAARESYALTIPAAAATWDATQGDAARLQLLISENLLGGSAQDYLTMAGGYSVQTTGGLRARTILLHDDQPKPY